MPLHDSLHCSLSCEKTCCTTHSGTFGLWGLSEQIGEAHLGLGMLALRRKLGLVSYSKYPKSKLIQFGVTQHDTLGTKVAQGKKHGMAPASMKYQFNFENR